MQFDGVERYKQVRKERHLGALRREGFQPARRHPSASRRRDTLSGELRSQESGDLPNSDSKTLLGHLATYHGRDNKAHSPVAGGGGGGFHGDTYDRNGYDRDRRSAERLDGHVGGGVGGGMSHQRSFSAPPVRKVEPRQSSSLSTDLKMQRASSAARSLSKMEGRTASDPLQRAEVKELYGWLRTQSLHEYLPALLEMGVEAVSHIGDVEVEDLEEAGMARPERKRFLRAQAELSLGGGAQPSVCVRSGAVRRERGMESLMSEELSGDWPSSPGPGGEPMSEGTSPQISARSGAESDSSALSQAITGTPTSGVGDPGSAHASPLIDFGKLLQRSRAICTLRPAEGTAAKHGFLISLGSAGAGLVTTASVLDGLAAVGSMVAVFEADDGQTRDLRLDAEALLWSDAALDVAVMTCTGAEGFCAPMSLATTACSIDDELLALHPDSGKQFSFHRVMSAQQSHFLFASQTTARPAPGLPIFCGGVVAGVSLGATDDGTLCRAVTMQAIMRGLQGATQSQRQAVQPKSAPSSRASSGRRPRGLPPRHTADMATSPIQSPATDTQATSALGSSTNGINVRLPFVAKGISLPGAFEDHVAPAQPPIAIVPQEPVAPSPLVRAFSLPLKLESSVPPVAAFPPSRSHHGAGELRPSTPPKATPPPEAPNSADCEMTDANGAVWSVSSSSGRAQRKGSGSASLPSTSLPVMSSGVQPGEESEARESSVRIFPVQHSVSAPLPARLDGVTAGIPSNEEPCSRVLDADFRKSAEAVITAPASKVAEIAVVAATSEGAADSDVMLSDQEGSALQRTLDDVEEEDSTMDEQESQAESSVPASPEPVPAKPHNALEHKLQEASPQVLVHILAHCPEQHILRLALARCNSMLAACDCEGPCACSDRLEFERVGGVSVLLDVARKYSTCEHTQVHALGALGSLALCQTVQRAIAMEGGVQVALGAMAGHPDSSQVSCLGCKLLCNLAFEDEGVQMEVCVAEGVDAVVRAMKTFLDSEQVQAEGCGSLCNLAASAATWEYVREGGGIGAVVDGMKKQEDSAEVQFKGCCALCSMSGDNEQNEEAVRFGAVDVLIKAMLSHPNAPALQYKGCSALLNLSQVHGVSQLVSRKGGVAAIFKATEACDGDVHLACKALRALKALCVSKETFVQVARGGGVWSVVQTMKKHSSDEEVQIRGISLLGTLCRDSASLQVITEQGGLEAICSAARSMSHSETLLVEACSALAVLSLQQGAIPRITETGVLETLMLACEGLHADSDTVRTAAARLERALLPPGMSMFHLEGQAKDTRDTLARRMLTRSLKAADRRPISATLAVSRPSTGRPDATGARKSEAANRRPASATFASAPLAGKEGMSDGSKDNLRGSLMLQHQILTLKKEAESLRRENLQIMAGAVSGMAETPELSGVNVDCTISSMKRLGTPVRKDSLFDAGNHGNASGHHPRGRPQSGQRLRASSLRAASPYLQPLPR